LVFRKILVAEDFTNVAYRPLELAVEMAASAGSEVLILSVIDDSFPNPDILSFRMPWADYHRHLREEAMKRLGELIREVGAKGVKVEVVRGKPAAKIVEFAVAEKYDLIVMATHGSGAIRQAMMGSVTRKVIHEAPCPLLLVPLALEAESPARPKV
jgi:nucleotide-binding universal stress UspA family protein